MENSDINNNQAQTQPKYTAKDFASDVDVRWCPGCGDFSILAQVQRTFPQILGLEKEKIAIISGIGCSSRFPYYMNTYGFHTIHGRAAAIASGVKTANPDLSVWIMSGDGDLLSIGGNHFIHLLRRNLDVNVVMFNNRIYGLTKGQVSPTSLHGAVTKTTPYGNIEYPVNPIAQALGMEGTFIARSIDREPKHLQDMILRCYNHHGTSFLEVFQNCVIFNDGAFEPYTNKDTKDDRVLFIENGKPLIFGKNKDKGIRLNGFKPEVININEGPYGINDVVVYDDKSREMAFMVSLFHGDPKLPMPVGVFLDIERHVYEEDLTSQIKAALGDSKADVDELLRGNSYWEIK